jgi:putative oxidoreductase
MNNSQLNNITTLLARILMSVMFIMAGWGKIGGYAGTQGYMESMGVPGMLLPAVIALELLGGIAILVGYKARYAAFLLAGFSIVAALIFHSNFADQMQSIMFMKNLAIAGGLLYIFANGAGKLSFDKE